MLGWTQIFQFLLAVVLHRYVRAQAILSFFLAINVAFRDWNNVSSYEEQIGGTFTFINLSFSVEIEFWFVFNLILINVMLTFFYYLRTRNLILLLSSASPSLIFSFNWTWYYAVEIPHPPPSLFFFSLSLCNQVSPWLDSPGQLSFSGLSFWENNVCQLELRFCHYY